MPCIKMALPFLFYLPLLSPPSSPFWLQHAWHVRLVEQRADLQLRHVRAGAAQGQHAAQGEDLCLLLRG